MKDKIFNNSIIYFEGLDLYTQRYFYYNPFTGVIIIDFHFTKKVLDFFKKDHVYKLTCEVFGDLNCTAEDFEVISELHDVVQGKLTFKVVK